MIKVKVFLESVEEPKQTLSDTFEVAKLLAATPEFPYWTFWYPEDKNGDTRVRFFRMKDTIQVDMIGKDEDEKPKLAEVIPIKQDDHNLFFE